MGAGARLASFGSMDVGTAARMRSTREVFEDHLALRLKGYIETDIARNYSPSVVAITNHGRFTGHEGIRAGARLLQKLLPDARFRYVNRVVEGEIAFLEWTGA